MLWRSFGPPMDFGGEPLTTPSRARLPNSGSSSLSEFCAYDKLTMNFCAMDIGGWRLKGGANGDRSGCRFSGWAVEVPG